MGEAVKIKEGGVDRSQNQINKLKTNMQGGGVCYWLPETELQTDDKRVTQNGNYTAEHEGYYGYNEIIVSIPGTGDMNGKGADGNDYSITVDDNGYIVETKIPSAIQITTPPVKVIYNDGETIDYTGMVVKLYDGEGNLFTDSRYPDGIIPATELLLPENTAHYDGSGGGSSDLDTSPMTQPLPVNTEMTVVRDGRDEMVVRGECITGYYHLTSAEDFLCVIAASKEPGSVIERTGEIIPLASEYGHNGKTAYFTYSSINGYYLEPGEGQWQAIAVDNRNPNVSQIAWTLLYGNGGQSTQSLPVQWISTYNGKTLETAQDIAVYGASV